MADAEAKAAGDAAETARQAASRARRTAQVGLQVDDAALALTIDVAQRAAVGANAQAAQADAARARATAAAEQAEAVAEQAKRAIREVWGVVALYERTHPGGIDRRTIAADRRRGMKDDWLRWGNEERRMSRHQRRG